MGRQTTDHPLRFWAPLNGTWWHAAWVTTGGPRCGATVTLTNIDPYTVDPGVDYTTIPQHVCRNCLHYADLTPVLVR